MSVPERDDEPTPLPADGVSDGAADGIPDGVSDRISDGAADAAQPGGPGAGELGRDAVELAWADIVARWEGRVPSADDPNPTGGAAVADRGGGDRSGPDRGDPGRGADDQPRDAAAVGPVGPPAPPVLRPATVSGPRDHELAEEDESFVPPVPPPLSRVRPATWLPWAGVLGGPLLLVVAAVLYGAVPGPVLALAVAAFCGGAVLLVLRLPVRRDEDGDDGARV